MTQTLFDHPLAASDAWENASTYTFFLKGADAKSAPAMGAPPMLQGKATTSFAPNVVVTRVAQAGRELGPYADEQRKAMQAKLPKVKLLREGKTTLAGLPALESEYEIPLDAPHPTAAQWHASLARDGFFYNFVGTSTKERFAKDRKLFKELADSWKAAR